MSVKLMVLLDHTYRTLTLRCWHPTFCLHPVILPPTLHIFPVWLCCSEHDPFIIPNIPHHLQHKGWVPPLISNLTMLTPHLLLTPPPSTTNSSCFPSHMATTYVHPAFWNMTYSWIQQTHHWQLKLTKLTKKTLYQWGSWRGLRELERAHQILKSSHRMGVETFKSPLWLCNHHWAPLTLSLTKYNIYSYQHIYSVPNLDR